MPRLTAVAVTVALTLGVLAAAVPAGADPSRSIPLGRVGAVVADPAVGLVFVAGTGNDFIDDGFTGGVVAVRADGSRATKIAGTTDAAGVALGPDGSVYATETDGNIVVIDPAALSVTATFATGAAACPDDIAFVGQAPWFGYGGDRCATATPAGLATLDLASGAVTSAMVSGRGQAVLSGVPGHDDELLASSLTDNGDDLDVLTVSGGSLSMAQQVTGVRVSDVAVDPGANRVYVATGSGVDWYDPADLAAGPTPFETPQREAESVALSADGTYLAASVGYPGEPDSIDTFQTATGARVRTYDTSTPGSAGQGQTTIPTRRGLAWVGTTLTSVYEDYGDAYPRLQSLPTATRYVSTLSASSPHTAVRSRPLTVSGTLRTIAGPLGQVTLAVSRTDLDGTHRLPAVRTDSQGHYVLRDTPSVGGTVRYTVAYAGDATHLAVSRSAVTAVSRSTPVLSISLPHASYNWGQKTTITAHLGPTFRNRVVTISGRPAGLHEVLIKRARVDRRGYARAVIFLPYNSLFTVRFDGDEHFAPRTVGRRITVHAVVTTSLSKPVARAGTYRIYKASKGGGIGVGVSPRKPGAVAHFTLQVLKGARWHTAGRSTATLNKGSVVGVRFSGRPGRSYRIRGEYRGDRLNAAGVGRWQYVRFR